MRHLVVEFWIKSLSYLSLDAKTNALLRHKLSHILDSETLFLHEQIVGGESDLLWLQKGLHIDGIGKIFFLHVLIHSAFSSDSSS